MPHTKLYNRYEKFLKVKTQVKFGTQCRIFET